MGEFCAEARGVEFMELREGKTHWLLKRGLQLSFVELKGQGIEAKLLEYFWKIQNYSTVIFE